MARRFQYQGRRRAVQYVQMRGRRTYKRYGGARGIAGLSIPWLAGGALGYAAPRFHPMQDAAITALAVLPIRLPYGMQNVAKGYVFGSIAKSFIPGLFGSNGSASSAGSNFI